MSVLASRLDPASAAYRANRSANLRLLEELAEQLAKHKTEAPPCLPPSRDASAWTPP